MPQPSGVPFLGIPLGDDGGAFSVDEEVSLVLMECSMITAGMEFPFEISKGNGVDMEETEYLTRSQRVVPDVVIQ
jgi:hypothetical protein